MFGDILEGIEDELAGRCAQIHVDINSSNLYHSHHHSSRRRDQARQVEVRSKSGRRPAL